MQPHSPVPSPPVVLVVDDDETTRVFLNKVLTRCGFAVTLAATGEQALQAYQRHHDMIALVMLDNQLPDMDGPATLTGCQTINPLVRCWILIEASDAGREEDLLKSGAALVLRKPVDLDVLRQALAGVTGYAAPCAPLTEP